MQIKSKHTLCLISDSEKNMDMYYATKFLVPDSFIYFLINGKSHILVTRLEFGRAKKEAKVDNVHSIEDLSEKMRQRGLKKFSYGDLAAFFLAMHRKKKILVPWYFPTQYANTIASHGINVTTKPLSFFDDRLVKSESEIKSMIETLRVTEKAMGHVINILKQSRIKNNALYYHGKKLTSEYLKSRLAISLAENDCLCEHPIIACGDQACDPHGRGTGVLRPYQAIIIDVFPKSLKNMYYADITRTVVKGSPPDNLRLLYNAVYKAQKKGISLIKHNAKGTEVHKGVQKVFDKLGWKTEKQNGMDVGFIHGTGHGLGLDIHEYPGLGRKGNIDALKSNHVVTVEPGLYYPGLGGIRIEDTVVVKKQNCVNITKFPKFFEIS